MIEKLNAEELRTQSRGEVRVQQLRKVYGETVAVNSIDLSICSGEFFTLLGPSGSGKSTTLLIIAGFQTPTEGKVYINGVDTTLTPAHKRNLGMVFQHYALFPHMTAFENVAFPLRMRRTSKSEISRRVNEMLELVGLPGLGKRYMRQLSGGQQQRVALARAMVYEPAVLLLDEPLGALDRKLRESMQIELKRIQREVGITVIYVTHDQEEALTMSDRIAIIHHGQIEQMDTPRNIYEQPASMFVAGFVGKSNFISGQLVATDESGCVVGTTLGVDVMTPPTKEMATGATVSLAVRPERLSILADGEVRTNTIDAVIRDTAYMGESTIYTLEPASDPGQSLQVRATQSPSQGAWPVGDHVRVGWHKEDGVLLRA